MIRSFLLLSASLVLVVVLSTAVAGAWLAQMDAHAKPAVVAGTREMVGCPTP